MYMGGCRMKDKPETGNRKPELFRFLILNFEYLISNVRFQLAGMVVLYLIAFNVSDIHAQQPPSGPEYRVKAGFIYSFTKFTTWPQAAFRDAGNSIILCIASYNPVIDAASSLGNKIIKKGENEIFFSLQDKIIQDGKSDIFLSLNNKTATCKVKYDCLELADIQKSQKSLLTGDTDVYEDCDRADNKIVMKKKMKVIKCSSGKETGNCHILFVPSADKDFTREILNSVKNRNVLTIGEMEGFIQMGGIINFFKKKKRLQFEVNMDALRRSGLELSSKLLNSAKIVREK